MNCEHPKWTSTGLYQAKCNLCGVQLYFDRVRDPMGEGDPHDSAWFVQQRLTNPKASNSQQERREKQKMINPFRKKVLNVLAEPDPLEDPVKEVAETLPVARVSFLPHSLPTDQVEIKSARICQYTKDQLREFGKEAYEKHDLKGVAASHGLTYLDIRPHLAYYARSLKVAAGELPAKRGGRPKKRPYHFHEKPEQLTKEINQNGLPVFKDAWSPEVQVEWLRSYTRIKLKEVE